MELDNAPEMKIVSNINLSSSSYLDTFWFNTLPVPSFTTFPGSDTNQFVTKVAGVVKQSTKVCQPTLQFNFPVSNVKRLRTSDNCTLGSRPRPSLVSQAFPLVLSLNCISFLTLICGNSSLVSGRPSQAAVLNGWKRRAVGSTALSNCRVQSQCREAL